VWLSAKKNLVCHTGYPTLELNLSGWVGAEYFEQARRDMGAIRSPRSKGRMQ